MTVSAIKLHFDFYVAAWIRLDSIGNDNTIISKTTGSTAYTEVFVFKIASTTGLLSFKFSNNRSTTDVKEVVDKTATPTVKIGASAWRFVGVSVDMNDAINSDVRLWIHDGTGDNTYTESVAAYWQDDTWAAVIGGI